MYLVDSHCHIDRLKETQDREGVQAYLDRAEEQAIRSLLCVCIDLENFDQVKTLAEQWPQVYASVGVHPNHKDSEEPDVERLLALADDPNIVAIGETGLDYFREKGDLDWQRDRFRVHIEASKQCGKPLIIHTREAREDTIKIMHEAGAEQAGGVMHCFTETWDMAQQAMDLGFYISFSGIVTFGSAEELREVARKIPMDRMLVETDSPYLAPTPHRGKQNEPAYTRLVADYIAELRGIPVEALAEQTTENFFRLFSHAQR